MPKTKHTATAPDGTVFKRTSESRVYTHMVAGQLCPKHAMAVATHASNEEQDVRNWRYMNEKVTGVRSWYDFESEESRQRDRDQVAMGQLAYLAEKLAERIARVEAQDFTKWFDLGWASRFDLACKNADSHRGRASWKRIEILEAVIG